MVPWIDGNAFGGFYVDQNYRLRKIEEAKDRWKYTIISQKTMFSEMVKNEGENYIKGELTIYIKYYMLDNPYYGWKEEQLEIVVEK